jgi:hypothetical protein
MCIDRRVFPEIGKEIHAPCNRGKLKCCPVTAHPLSVSLLRSHGTGGMSRGHHQPPTRITGPVSIQLKRSRGSTILDLTIIRLKEKVQLLSDYLQQADRRQSFQEHFPASSVRHRRTSFPVLVPGRSRQTCWRVQKIPFRDK